MFSTHSNRTTIRRNAVRAGIAGALVAPILMFGAQASMASNDKSDSVSDAVVVPKPPTVSASTDCVLFKPTLIVIIKSNANVDDTYDFSAYTAKGLAGHNAGQLAAGATKTWSFEMTENVTDVVVITGLAKDSSSLGAFPMPRCTDTPTDTPNEDPKTPPATVPATTIPPTVPPVVVTVPAITVPPMTVPPTTVVPTTEPVATTVAPVPAVELPKIDEIGIPVLVLGEIQTAQPAQAVPTVDGAPLAFTGSNNTGLLAAIASVLVIGGGGLVVIARRRPRY